MARPKRPLFEGAFYHVFNRGVEKRPILFDDQDRKVFFQLLANAVGELNVRLFCYCLLDNHFHLFLQTPYANLNKVMHQLEGPYVQYINQRYQRVGGLFQGRYGSRLVDAERYALVLARYIHQNPTEAGVVAWPEDYPWSSYPCYIGKLPKWKWLDTEWLLGQFHHNPGKASTLLQAFHQFSPSETELALLKSKKPLTKEPILLSPLP